MKSLLSFTSEEARLSHPEAKFIPEKLWLRLFEEHLTPQERDYLTKPLAQLVLTEPLAIDEWVCILLQNTETDLILFLAEYKGSVTNLLYACIEIQKTDFLLQYLKKYPQNAERIHELLMRAVKAENLLLIDYLYQESGADNQFLIRNNQFELVKEAFTSLKLRNFAMLLLRDCEEAQLPILVKKHSSLILKEITYVGKKHYKDFQFDSLLFSKILKHVEKSNSDYYRVVDFIISEAEEAIFLQCTKLFNHKELAKYYHVSASHGRWDIMLQIETLCNIQKTHRLYAFVVAAHAGKLSIIRKLVEHNKDEAQEMLASHTEIPGLEGFEKKDYSSFCEALQQGNKDIIEYFLALCQSPFDMIISNNYAAFRISAKAHTITTLLISYLKEKPEYLSKALEHAVQSSLYDDNVESLNWLFDNYSNRITPFIENCFEYSWKDLKPKAIHWLYEKGFWNILPHDLAINHLLKADIRSRHVYLSYYDKEKILLLQEYAIIGSAAEAEQFKMVNEYLHLIPEEEQDKALRSQDYSLLRCAIKYRQSEFLSAFVAKCPSLPQELLIEIANMAIRNDNWSLMAEMLKYLDNPLAFIAQPYRLNYERCNDALAFSQVFSLLRQDEAILRKNLPSIIKLKSPQIMTQIIATNDLQFHNTIAQAFADSAFRKNILSADINILKWINRHHSDLLKESLEKNHWLEETLKSGNYREFAYFLKHYPKLRFIDLETAEILLTKAPLDLVLDFLKKAMVYKTLNPHFKKNCIAGLHRALKKEHMPLANFLLNIPSVFGYAQAHEADLGNYIGQFIEAKYADLNSSVERAHSQNEPFDINTENEQKIVLFLLIRFIRDNTQESNRRVAQLLQVLSIANLAHKNITSDYPGGNELLRLAQQVGNQTAIMALVEIEAVRNLAVEHNFYQGPGANLAQIIQDRESSMRALSAQEKNNLKTLATHYKEQCKKLTIDDLREAIKDCYESQKAYIKCDEKKMELPCDWQDFIALSLPEAEYNQALEAYYRHPIHTALRYISEPNYWINKNEAEAYYINHCENFPGEYSSIYKSFEKEIILFWVAAVDKTQISAEMLEEMTAYQISPENFVINRFKTYLNGLALLNRAHNWDKTRIILNVNGKQVDEEYDDFLSDNPSCYPGTLFRLFHAVVHHPLLEKFNKLTLKREIIHFVRLHFEKAILHAEAQKYYNILEAYFEDPSVMALEEELNRLNIKEDQIQIFIDGLIEKYGNEFTDYSVSFLHHIYQRFNNKLCPTHLLAFYQTAQLDQIFFKKISQADENILFSDEIADIPSMEKIAAFELTKRSPHFASFLTEEEIQQHKTVVETFPQIAPTDDIGTAAPITWQPYFTWVNSIRVNHKKDSSLRPIDIHIYGHWENGFLYFTGHSEDFIKFGGRSSDAKIQLSEKQDSKGLGCIVINALNAHGDYRLGSAFIQIAIENSLSAGYGGKVLLTSTRDSGLFYFKLGFVPVCERIFQCLKNGEQINGGEMYLPQDSIDVWVNKIADNCILPHQLTIPKITLLQADDCVNDQTELNESANSQEPPNGGNKEKIQHILHGLIKNMECKTNKRATWFGYGINSKIQKLKAIDSWLSTNDLDAVNERKILSLIRDISSIKRNPLGFFTPHSSREFNEELQQHHLVCSDNFHFSRSEMDPLKEQSDIANLLV